MTTRIMNSFTRNLATMFPWSFSNQRHNFEADYGWPTNITAEMLYRVSQRNGIARGAIDKLSLRTWNSLPEIWESEEPKESTLEAEIRRRLKEIRFWQACIEADRRAFISGYSALVLRFADSKAFSEPVGVLPGLSGFVKAEPVWASQLVVSSWVTDEKNPDFGMPKMFEMRESGIHDDGSGHKPPKRSFPVHPDRVIIWSLDGTVHSKSNLEPGFNDLLDMDKIKGAGGEGFWKTAKGQPVLEMDKEARPADMAEMMGVSVDRIKDALDAEVTEWLGGFNAALLLAGIKATPLNIALPQPEEFFNIALRSFAASVGIPIRSLVGNETGERATTQDQEELDRVCMARRERYIIPTLNDFIARLKKFSVLKERDYVIGWESLLDMSPDQKMIRAKQMAEVNKIVTDVMTGSHPVFTEDEIREEAGFELLTPEQLEAMEDEADDAPVAEGEEAGGEDDGA